VTAKPNAEIEIHSDAACVVTLRGEHDLSTSRELAMVMNLGTAYRHVLVDLSECTFLDSSALGALLRAAELARERAGALELVVAPRRGDAVRRALEIMGIDALLVIHPSRASAIASIEEKAAPPRPAQTMTARATVETPPASSGWVSRAVRGEKSPCPSPVTRDAPEES
jgi:anti-sigma B factor antagonist